jgi:16S rRNA (uracil1498-N3)-methyltransferase
MRAASIAALRPGATGFGDNHDVIRCFVPDGRPGVVTLSDDEAHHLGRVLRAREGVEVIAFDGRGREWQARVASVDKGAVSLELLDPREPAPEPPIAVTLAVGLLKGDQMNDVVRDATMLGAAAIVPIVSAHTAVSERTWRTLSPERWRRVAIASAKQCGRAVVPSVSAPVHVDEVLADATFGVRVICLEPAREWSRALPPAPPPGGRALLIVGPEGGWSAREVDEMRAAGVTPLSLGPRTLRAERAPCVALSVLWTAWGWA